LRATPAKLWPLTLASLKGSSADNETLAPLGMKKVHTDEFFYEVKREEVK